MYRITVKGIVQGVGFRPSVYRLATSMGLKGYVKNTGDGTVEIVVDSNVEEFVKRLRVEKPPMAVIGEIRIEEIESKSTNFQSFEILESGGKRGELSLPPPDVAVCRHCLSEVFDPKNRRYLYPFTSCTDCGQRYTVALKLPYDRENTTFKDFPLCEDCRVEYESVDDRRYYAQSIACPKCGPSYKLVFQEEEYYGIQAIKKAAELIDNGEFVAVKGWGGFHIACITDDEVVERLRSLLRRPQQPFAIMARNLEAVEKIAIVDDREREELISYIRPILVLKKKDEGDFSSVAPKLDTIGIMLPYSPLHHLLFSWLHSDYIVMTSANMPGEPMFIDDSVKELIPTILTHNLEINRVDDSVVKFVNGKRMIIRRSRGMVPLALPIDSELSCIAVGAELYNSIGFLKDGKAILSQYIGDTSNFKTYNNFFKRTFHFLKDFLDVGDVDAIVCDLHPSYNTSVFAERYAEMHNLRILKLQHHVAHTMSVMGEIQANKAIGIAVDGVGYGFDGTVWGCEVLYVDVEEKTIERLGRMEHIILPGGDLAVKYPFRALIYILSRFLTEKEIHDFVSALKSVNVDVEMILKQIERGINVPKASSAGRYMDVASSFLGVCQERTYEGEPAMKLESFARDMGVRLDGEIMECIEARTFDLDGRARKGEVKVIQIVEVFEQAYNLLKNGVNQRGLGFAFIDYLARSVSEIVREGQREYRAKIVMSGGVAYNTHFSFLVRKYLSPMEVRVNELVSAGDNGISFGQLYSAKFLEG